MRRPPDWWLRERCNYLGGTDVAAIMELDPYRTPRQVYLQKKSLDQRRVMNQAMIHGQNLELYLMQLYRRDTGRKLHKSRLYRDREHPFLACNPDYEVRGERGLLECRTSGQYAGQEFDSEGGVAPRQYSAQCMWQLAITGREWCDLAVLIGGQDYRVFRITRDDELIAGLRDKAIEWWRKHIEAEVPPPLTGDRADTEWTRDRFRECNGRTIQATPEVAELAFRLKAMKAAEKPLGREVARLENEIKESMSGAGELILPFGRITWKSDRNGRRTFKTLF
jgi:putative phage-type endonuclease